MTDTLAKPLYNISTVRSQTDLTDVTKLFYEYAASLGFSISYQDFDGEMASMPGKYAHPHGELMLARDVNGIAVGCVALRPLDLSSNGTDSSSVCEMKRLYVAPAGRGLGLGKALAVQIITAARQLGYQQMKLDSVPQMVVAVNMYKKLGFVEIPAYYSTPIEGTVFLGLDLRGKT